MTVSSACGRRLGAYLGNVALQAPRRGARLLPRHREGQQQAHRSSSTITTGIVFIALLNRVATRHGWTIFAFCLMDNHYHLVMRIDERGMSKGMCELNGTYALLFNGKHERINHLFGKRYWSDELESDERFRGGVPLRRAKPRREPAWSQSPDEYVWSSYQATVGIALGRVRVAVDELLSMFGRNRAAAIDELPSTVRRALTNRDTSGGSRRDETRARVSRERVLGARAAFWGG